MLEAHDEALAHVAALRTILATFPHSHPSGDFTSLDVVRQNLDAVEQVVRLHQEVTLRGLV